MWLIEHINNGQFFYLINEKQKYLVGRTDADIILKGDTSISRTHALLQLSNGELTLTDSSSKYGTYVNNNILSTTKINAGEVVQLHDGDRLRFGILKNEWKVKYIQIISMSSLLLEDDIKVFDRHLESLGGRVIHKWEPDCTHLTMAELNVTVKVLYALLHNIPIVTCEFWEHLLQAARKGQTELPRPELYIPKKSDSIIKKSDLNFSFRPERNKLFLGKIFVFMQKKHSDMYGPIVEMAGGKYQNLNSGVEKSFLIKANVVVIQYFTSTQSQMTQTINIISDFLEANSKRIIPEYEIGLAIVNCSIEKYCNPTYNILADLMPYSTSLNVGESDEILVKNTDSQHGIIESGPCLEQKEANSISVNSVVNTPKVLESPMKRKQVFDIDSDSDDEFIFPQNKKPNTGKFTDDIVQPVKSPKQNNSKPSLTRPSIKPLPIVINEKRTRSVSGFLEKTTTQHGIIESGPCLEQKETNSISVNSVVNTPKVLESPMKRKQVFDIDSDSDDEFIFPQNKKPNTGKFTDDIVQPVKSPKQNNSKPSFTRPSIKPLPIVINEKKTRSVSGFLEKTTTQPTEEENFATAKTCKRSRIAVITDDDSDDESDLFNFGSSNSISQNERQLRMDIGCSETLEDSQANAESEDLAPTEESKATNNKKGNNYISLPKVKQVSQKISTAGWLSSSFNKLDIKPCITKDESNILEYADDKTKNDFKNHSSETADGTMKTPLCGFEVRVCVTKKLKEKSFKSNESTTLCPGVNQLPRPNFKAFVKKCNYKPQNSIIKCSRNFG